MMIPSMHEDLAKDPVTEDIVVELRNKGVIVEWGPNEEGKQKTPSYRSICANLGHVMNRRKVNRRSVVITLGATSSPIDDIRHVQNMSSGATGWALADHLFRHGHDVTCVAGLTTSQSPDWLPLIIRTPTPDEMLKECKALSNDGIDAWIHAAAVLDYIVDSPAQGKIASQQGSLSLDLVESPKHIQELKEDCLGTVRIGFKLESGIKQKDLIYRAIAQIETSGMTAVIANRLEDLEDANKPRGYLVDSLGAHFVLQSSSDLHDAIMTLVERGPEA
jgi:phosphopantothenoylcysteine synthetase/decarboxylase